MCPSPPAGEPTLLTYDEVNTLFHEFGHALHGLFARVTYPKFAGTNTYRDFVEFPSQVNEMWMLWPEVLENYAKHYETGEPMPQEFVERIQASKAFNEGFATSEYLAAACLDQAWHSPRPPTTSVTDVAAFEAAALAEVGLDNPAVPTRYSSTYFQHVFATSATTPATTRTSGARCSTPTPWSGSRRTAASPGRTATGSASGCSGSAARRIRSRRTATSAGGTPTSSRCWCVVDWSSPAAIQLNSTAMDAHPKAPTAACPHRLPNPSQDVARASTAEADRVRLT